MRRPAILPADAREGRGAAAAADRDGGSRRCRLPSNGPGMLPGAREVAAARRAGGPTRDRNRDPASRPQLVDGESTGAGIEGMRASRARDLRRHRRPVRMPGRLHEGHAAVAHRMRTPSSVPARFFELAQTSRRQQSAPGAGVSEGVRPRQARCAASGSAHDPQAPGSRWRCRYMCGPAAAST